MVRRGISRFPPHPSVPEYRIRNPEYAAAVRDTFAKQGFLRALGAEIVDVSPGAVRVAAPLGEHLLQHHGFLHGGVVAALVDTACGCSALSLMPPDSSVLTVEYKVNFLAPAGGDRLLAHGRVVKAGRRLTVCSGEAFAESGGESRLVAVLLATMIRIPSSRAPAAEDSDGSRTAL